MHREFRIKEIVHNQFPNTTCQRKWQLTVFDETHRLIAQQEYDTLADAMNATDSLEWQLLPVSFSLSN